MDETSGREGARNVEEEARLVDERPPGAKHPPRASGGAPADEPEQGRPPVAWQDTDRVLEPKCHADELVDEASEESFPASDPPALTTPKRDAA